VRTLRLLPRSRRHHGWRGIALVETLLSNWRGEIAHLYVGAPRNAVTLGLSKAIHLYGLRCHDFLAVIDGAEMKAQTDIRAPSFARLDRYCECVAVAVGRLSVRIFGEETPAGERVAAELGRALQLTNILCDLAEDAKRHRLYLPRELLQAHGIFATTPSWVLAQPALPDVCRYLAVLAERHSSAAVEAMAACPRSTMRPVAAMLGIYRAVLHELLARGWQRLDEPVRISLSRRLALLLRHGRPAVEDRGPNGDRIGATHKGQPVRNLDRQAASPVPRSRNWRKSMEYQSPFENWYSYSTVHKPLPDFTCETGLELFPPELVPGVGHPLERVAASIRADSFPTLRLMERVGVLDHPTARPAFAEQKLSCLMLAGTRVAGVPARG